MPTIELTTRLSASPATVRAHIMRAALLMHISAPLLSFRPLDPPELPEIWQDGRYRFGLRLFGIVPIGWQMVGLEIQPVRDAIWSVRDDGHSTMIKTWDHWIEVAPDGDGTRYTDRVTLEAGILTPAIVLFTRIYFGHRHRRWQKLVENGFDYSR